MTRLQKTEPWCAVIAPTEDVARQYMDAFGLSAEIWKPLMLSQSTMGFQFDRIVIIRPHWRTTPAEINEFERQVSDWFLRVNRGGVIKVI
ncbi:hypothetical protein [Bradyrhizobium sp. DASA03007]|uniref:hypothetical protein n=1 Tax=unclassified Bradyrhizobium TaxID=2631580 RepID=UPI003F719047